MKFHIVECKDEDPWIEYIKIHGELGKHKKYGKMHKPVSNIWKKSKKISTSFLKK
jgi:hypothetical protein